MKHTLLLVLLAAIAAFSLPGNSQSGVANPGPLTALHDLMNTQIDNPVESQTDWVTAAENCGGMSWWPCDQSRWVVNPFVAVPCAWDPDDHWWQQGIGYLAAGGVFSVNECKVAEASSVYYTIYDMTTWWSNNARPVGAYVKAPSDNLDVSLCFSPQGRCFSVPPLRDGKEWLYQACVAVEYRPDDPALTLIPESGLGGYGVVTTVTFRVGNPTGKRVNSVTAGFAAVGWADSAADCAYQTNWPHRSYPFLWSAP